MAESIVSDIVVRVLEFLSQSIAERIAPYFGGREKLNELRLTMTLIKARLSDAESRQEDENGHLIKEWLRELKRLLYRLEDLFEEVAMSEQRSMFTSQISKVVCFLPSKLSSLRMNKIVAQEVEGIMSQVNLLKDNMVHLQLRELNMANCHTAVTLMDTRETHSFIREEEVIGRNEDRDAIISMLLNSGHTNDVLSVIPIVGMGGLGKTALAQLVYNDERITQLFEFKYWACISDKISSFKELVGKVLRSMTNDDGWQQFSMEELQSKLRQVVTGKQFLLVLDDIWDEDRDWWIQLRNLLCEGKLTSKILVTSRSQVVALNMGTVEPYTLQGLQECKSWELFKSLAYREGQEERYPNLASIGTEIVKKCGNVPLAIRTIAGLLYSKDTVDEWVYVRDKLTGMIDKKEKDIMSTLKLSYYHLLPQQKLCFAYCSVYPKDYEFEIKQLICQWMAQGFVKSLNEGLTCFMELLKKCFFQDVTRDTCGIMVGCKMHDLMHDLAQYVGDECLIVDKPMEDINNNVRHVTITDTTYSSLPWKAQKWLAYPPQIRSLCLLTPSDLWDLNAIFLQFRQLRRLDLVDAEYESLPNSIGKLAHLRYLRARVTRLPKGITRLQNLQTLNVSSPFNKSLGELPRDFNKLTGLRHLEINDYELDDMPPGFGQLEHLETLGAFVVGKNNGLDALSRLNLMGKLAIFFAKYRQNAISEAMMANLKSKKLTHLSLRWPSGEESDTQVDEMLTCLRLPLALKYLEVDRLKGVRLSWGIQELPKIVNLKIYECKALQYLPSFGQLPHLKKLDLCELHSLEYVEDGGGNSGQAISSSGAAQTASSAMIYFPSLESLTLEDMPKLKQWSRIEYANINKQLQQSQQIEHFFPRLLTLEIWECPKLMSMPQVPLCAAQNLRKSNILENLAISSCYELDLWAVKNNGGGNNNSVNFSSWQCLKSLRVLSLANISMLDSLPKAIACFTMLQKLSICRLDNLKTLPEWIGQLTQLHSLRIIYCTNLEALPKSIRELTALQLLYISNCPLLARRCEKPDGDDWPLIQDIPNVEVINHPWSRTPRKVRRKWL